MKYVAYYRVSTRKQGDSGLGLDGQKSSVERFVKGEGGELFDEFTEVESGRKSERPQLDKAIRRCLLTGATLVIAKLDRLSRDVAFLAMLENSELKFIAADMPHANQFTRGMMANLAQYEAELISERTKAGLAAAKARGQTLGNPNLQLVRNNDTTAAIQARVSKAEKRNAQVRELITEFEAEAGRELSLRELADRLNSAGYQTARGKRFSATQVQRIKAA